MKRYQRIMSGICFLILNNPLYAFCIYNQTTGLDPYTKEPIIIGYQFTSGERWQLRDNIKQNSWRCTLPNKKDIHSISLVQPLIMHHNTRHFPICGDYTSPYLEVYNQDGYIIVKGSYANRTPNFKCELHRKN